MLLALALWAALVEHAGSAEMSCQPYRGVARQDACSVRGQSLEMAHRTHALVQLQTDYVAASIKEGNAPQSTSERMSSLSDAATSGATHEGDVIDKIVFIKLHSVGSSTIQ
eukprot:422264-Amphidinium_carterae.1